MSKESQLIKYISSSYDNLPYTSKPFSQTHPSNLKAVCSLFDIETPPVEIANILEIGCALGGNIIPLAVQYPEANIVGLDLSERQISLGNKAVKTMGLKNIQLKQQDITDYEPPLQHFDYIICHGVYSWVPEQVKKAILRTISTGISEQGVAIVSYNTYPGWKIREVYRDAMRYRSEPVDDLLEKVKYGLGMLDFLKENLPQGNPWGMAIEQYYDGIRHADTAYLAHEYLEIINQPCYFYEFMASAQEAGLHFATEADFQRLFFPPVALSDESHQAMEREAGGDALKLEQLSDFLSNRTFRQTLLTRHNNTPEASLSGRLLKHDALSALHIQGSFFKTADDKDNTQQWKSARNPDGIAFKDAPATEAIFTALNAAKGQTVNVGQLWKEIESSDESIDKTTFFNTIAEIIIRRAVNIRSEPVTWKETKATMPLVSTAHRKQYQWIKDNPDSISLSTAFHEPFALDIIGDELMPLLDGTNSTNNLVKHLVSAAAAKRVIFYDQEQQPISDAKQIVTAAKEHVNKLLDTLRYHGLLC